MAAAAQAGIKVDGSLTHELRVHPGETSRRVVTVRNTGSIPTEVKVYRRDYHFNADGRNDYGEPGKLPRSNADWLQLNREQMRIPAGGAANVYYEIQVPNDPALHGTYWSMILVEPVAAREAVAQDLEPGETQLSQVIRYGIQIVTHIRDSGQADLVFENPRLVKETNHRLFIVDLKNRGTRWIRPRLYMELHDLQGGTMQKVEGSQQRLYPNTSVRSQFDLSALPPGEYRALIIADGGGDALFGTQIDLSLH
ncbi:MAG: hypothetical protein J5I81_10000 [Nitrococcus mobilis]|nr:hypothetical protein [Nitrococcus mobilis]